MELLKSIDCILIISLEPYMLLCEHHSWQLKSHLTTLFVQQLVQVSNVVSPMELHIFCSNPLYTFQKREWGCQVWQIVTHHWSLMAVMFTAFCLPRDSLQYLQWWYGSRHDIHFDSVMNTIIRLLPSLISAWFLCLSLVIWRKIIISWINCD